MMRLTGRNAIKYTYDHMNPKTTKLGQSAYPLKRIIRKILVTMSQSSWLSTRQRIYLLKKAQIKIGKRCFIGSHVGFDGIRPDLVEIGEHVTLTSGVKILSHFYNPDDCGMYLGKVTIGNDVFIGINSLIVNSVEIGEGAVVAAGSVVTKDIPAWEIWGGNPAKFIRKRQPVNKLNKAHREA